MTDKEKFAAYMSEWRKNHRDSVNKTAKKWRDRNPDKIKEYNHRQYLRRKALKQSEGGINQTQ